MKQCCSCRQNLPVSDFPKNKSKPDGLAYACKACKKKQQANWYQSRKGEQRKRIDDRKQELRRLKREYLESHPCVDCGFNDIRALQFDHVSGTKENNICTMIQNGYSWVNILKEIEKCEVRCANCHAIVTSERRVVSSVGRAEVS